MLLAAPGLRPIAYAMSSALRVLRIGEQAWPALLPLLPAAGESHRSASSCGLQKQLKAGLESGSSGEPACLCLDQLLLSTKRN
jgi:hypothetical protein